MMQSGKIDKVYEEIIKLEDRFNRLEREQRQHIEEYVEKAAATIITEIKKRIEECECNKEILSYLELKLGKGKQKEEEPVGEIQVKNKLSLSLGWKPENLKIENTPFHKK